MTQSYTNSDGTLIIPGAYSKYTVATENSGLATTGVVVLVGEADAGPDYTLETDLESNAFGPDQIGDVMNKYKTGNLVDAFRNASNPSQDRNITGAPASIILVKTNPSTKASGALTAFSGSYPNIQDKSYGALGNLIYYTVTASTAEVVPTTGSFTYIPAVGTVTYAIRLNGGAALSGGTLGANTSPTAFVTAIDGLAGIDASGGVSRGTVASSSRNAVVAASGLQATITVDVAWSATPLVGDTLTIATGSAIAGAGNANVGAYVITAATANTIVATKLSDAGKGGAAIGTVTAPANVASIAITTDLTCYSPVVISATAGSVVPGIGKSLEIAGTTVGTDLLTRCAFQLNATPVTWISVSATPVLISSASEYKALLTVNRQSDNTLEEIAAGGDVVLKVSYTGTSASLTYSATTKILTTTVAGGSGASLASVNVAHFPTIADLAAYLNSQTGYKAAVGTAVLGQLPATALDEGTFTIASQFGAYNGRLKADAYNMAKEVASNSMTIEFTTAPTIGLPATQTVTFMAGGAKGATTSAIALAAITALEQVNCNFVIPLFSQDAADDIALGLTDSNSTYSIDALNAAVKDHVTRMSQFKRKKNRQGIVSYEGSFTEQKNASSNIGNFRVAMTFQDFKVLGSDGLIHQYQPWMGAVNAASLQSAGFYKGIVKKLFNVSGVLHNQPATFNDKNDSQVEEALKAGLLVARKRKSGGFEWVSDQSTYGADTNFVFNSLQAVYVSDIISLSTAERMENAFVGANLADLSAAIGLSFFEGIMADFLTLKLIAPSDDAPRGFKNVRVKINGNAMEVTAEVKAATLLYFVPIGFTISKITQTAQG